MKTILKFTFIFCLTSLFISCDSEKSEEFEEPEIIKDITLSLKDAFNWFDEIDVEFDILSGNGGYITTSSDEKMAKVRVEDNKVIVNFLKNGSITVTIEDSKGKTAKTILNVNNSSLAGQNYTLFIEKGSTTTIDDVAFGAGGYKIENIRGSSVKLLLDGDNIIVEAMEHGNTYSDLVDKRGSSMNFNIFVVAIHKLTKNNLEINMIKDQRASIICKWGQGWKITSSPFLCDVVVIPSTKPYDYDTVQIDSHPNAWGNEVIHLKDKDGNLAQIVVNIK